MLSATTTTSPPLSLPPAGEEQPGDRPGLPAEDAGAAAGAGADGAPGDAGAAQRQVRVHRGGQVRHHARYAPRLLHRIPPPRRSTPRLARYLDLALFLDLALYFRVVRLGVPLPISGGVSPLVFISIQRALFC